MYLCVFVFVFVRGSRVFSVTCSLSLSITIYVT